MNFYPVIYPVIWLNLFFIGFLCMYICVCIHMCVCMWVKSLYFEIYKTMLPTNDNNLISAFLFEILCLVPLMVLWIFFFLNPWWKDKGNLSSMSLSSWLGKASFYDWKLPQRSGGFGEPTFLSGLWLSDLRQRCLRYSVSSLPTLSDLVLC